MKQLLCVVLAAVLLVSSGGCIADGAVLVSSSSSTLITTTATTTTTIVTTTTTESHTTTTTATTQAPCADVIVSDVPFIDQRVLYPTGCESVSTVMVLQYWGYSLSVDTFIDAYLPCGDLPKPQGDTRVGCDPYLAFPGNPRTTQGYGCFAPVITAAVQNILTETHRVTDLTGTSLETLCETYINNGIPVIVWATSGMQKPYLNLTWQTPEGNIIEWISPNHCLVLTGYNDTHYFFNDPQKGNNVAYKRAACETAFNTLGQQAVVIDLVPVPTTLAPITTTITVPLPTSAVEEPVTSCDSPESPTIITE